MSHAALMTLGVAVLALYAGAFHAWIFAYRRKDRAHLWHAITAFGVMGLALGTALLYESETVAEAERWQRLLLICSLPITVGFIELTWDILGIRRRRVRIPIYTFSALMIPLVTFTDWVFNHDPLHASFPPLGLEYVRSGMSSVGIVMTGIYGVALVYVFVLAMRHVRVRDPESQVLAVTIPFLSFTGMSDAAAAIGIHSFPFMLPVGYLAILLGNSAVLTRRFAQSMNQVEEQAGNLHEQVEMRTAELRDKELQLAHGERMAVVGTLAAGLAHEINNPMAFISSNLHHLEEIWEKPEEKDEAMEIMAECHEGVERVRVTVADLLSLARREERPGEMVDLPDVVDSVLRMVRYEARNRALVIKDLKPCEPIVGDQRLLAQVVLNLVMNGLQAIPEGKPGENRLLVTTEETDATVRLRVEDTGTGIPKPFQNEIFDPFFTTKQVGEGTGLGLAVTRRIVREHSGRIEVESSPEGTVMTVDFAKSTSPG